MLKGRQYSAAVRDVIARLTESRECQKSAYMRTSDGDYHTRRRIIVIAGDRGLAGGYNANIFRLAAQYDGAQFIPIGKRACDLKDATGCRQAALAIFSEAYMRHDLELFKESGKYHRAACDLGDAESCREVQEYDTKLKQFDIYVQNNTQSGHASS